VSETRVIWIDREFHGHQYRVRERLGDDVVTLGEYATRPQAEDALDRILHPERYVEVEVPMAPPEATEQEGPQKKKRTWTRGITPADV
jgi:hypothetical protein